MTTLVNCPTCGVLVPTIFEHVASCKQFDVTVRVDAFVHYVARISADTKWDARCSATSARCESVTTATFLMCF